MSTFNMNQFGLTNQPGEVMNVNPSTISAKVSKDQATYLVPGDVVNIVAAEAGDAIAVDKIALGAAGLAVVLANAKKHKFAALDMMEIGLAGTIVTMVATTAQNRGAVQYIPSSGKVSATSGTQIGIQLDIASAAGDLVRVLVAPIA